MTYDRKYKHNIEAHARRLIGELREYTEPGDCSPRLLEIVAETASMLEHFVTYKDGGSTQVHFILDANGAPRECKNIQEWSQWFETADRIVGQNTFGKIRISTVFIGIDHNCHPTGPPILWETAIFMDDDSNVVERYCTEASAKAGHERIAAELRAAQ